MADPPNEAQDWGEQPFLPQESEMASWGDVSAWQREKTQGKTPPLQTSVSTPVNTYDNGHLVALAVRIKWLVQSKCDLGAPSVHREKERGTCLLTRPKEFRPIGLQGSYILKIDFLPAQSFKEDNIEVLTFPTAQLLLIFTASHEIECCAHRTGAEPELRKLEKQAPHVRKD